MRLHIQMHSLLLELQLTRWNAESALLSCTDGTHTGHVPNEDLQCSFWLRHEKFKALQQDPSTMACLL